MVISATLLAMISIPVALLVEIRISMVLLALVAIFVAFLSP